MKQIVSILLSTALAICLCAGAAAAEVTSDAVYCFDLRDFDQSETLVGVCVTQLPDADTGTMMLGTRVIRSGDILTAEQVSRMTFVPLRTEQDRQATLTYLPIYETRVAEAVSMTISIRGRTDEAPVAEDSTLETYKNLANSGTLKASDPEGGSLTYTLTQAPRRGEVVLYSDGTYTYTPKKNKTGTDSFRFTATDESGKASREATITVTVLKADSDRQYADTLGQSCRFSAEWLKNQDMFVGESINGQLCFQPEKTVSRGEFTAMLVQALGLRVEEDVSYTGFSDDVPGWLRPYLAAAMRSGLTAGWPHGDVFGAQEPITGTEAALLLQNALDLPLSTAATQEDAQEQVLQTLLENGIELTAQPLTRAQTADALYRASLLASTAPGMQILPR